MEERTCPVCGRTTTGQYCPGCGNKVPSVQFPAQNPAASHAWTAGSRDYGGSAAAKFMEWVCPGTPEEQSKEKVQDTVGNHSGTGVCSCSRGSRVRNRLIESDIYSPVRSQWRDNCVGECDTKRKTGLRCDPAGGEPGRMDFQGLGWRILECRRRLHC